MNNTFKKIGVIGSGVMGAQLAALFAGAGVDVELLDIVPPDNVLSSDTKVRNKFALEAISHLKKLKPAPFYFQEDISKIRPGNLNDNLGRLSDCDWVLEAVIEKLDIKKALYARLGNVLKDKAILTSNTSSMLRKTLAQHMPSSLSQRFLITHFFNPPRYMKLLEVVAGEDVNPDSTDSIISFAEQKLGKGVVRTKDTPLFIANRIGIFYVLNVMNYVAELGWPVEAVDTVLGQATGRPKTGVFRTVDMAGIDTLTYVAFEFVKNCSNDEDAARCQIPQFLQHMVMKGLIGNKVGRGFYFKDKNKGQILTFDPGVQDFRSKITFSTPSISEALNIQDPRERIRRVVFANDQAGEIAWPAISRAIVYAANRVPEISDDIVSIDCAMKWGYHWELGPFETWDALGVSEVAKRLEKEGSEVPDLVLKLLKKNHSNFYEWRDDKRSYFDLSKNSFKQIEGSEKRITFLRLKETQKTVSDNAGASLIDVGDGIFACEFHSKMNTIDEDVIKMLNASIDHVQKQGLGLLIANDGEQFSAGANILIILLAAEQKRWGEIEIMIREFQTLGQRIRFSKKPIMSVPHGLAIGGGCEVTLATAYRTASIETYMGLVEVGAGLIPAGGGCKNLLLRLGSNLKGGPQPKVNRAFELIATARVSGSAKEAMQLGFLTKDDLIVIDRELLLYEAKQKLINHAKDYKPPVPQNNICMPGHGGEMALVNATRGFIKQGKALEYDAFVASKLAHVLSGGDVPTIHETTEEHILDLEREAFLSLVGEEKTRERMKHLLKTGKPLRN